MLMNIWSISQFADKIEFDAWYSNVAIHHANWIKHQTHSNKRNTIAVFHLLKEALQACLLSKKTRYFIFEHSKRKTEKKEATKVSVSEGSPSGEASESNEATIKKKRE